jgi:uncharacterized membrane protein YadS
VSAVPVAILLGAALNNAPGGVSLVPSATRPGIAVASGRLLKVGIVCMGTKLRRVLSRVS